MVSRSRSSHDGQEQLDGEVIPGEKPSDPQRHLVLLATFFFLFLESGVLKSFGVLLTPLVFQLDSNFATVGVISSLPWTVEYLCAIIVKSLVNHIGLNKISAAGGLIAGVALTTSSFARTSWTLGTLFFLFGIGESMIIVPAIICLHRHYKKDFAFASSFAFVGTLMGVFILPILTNIVLEAYGPHNALLVLGGLCFNMFPIGLVIKLPEEKNKIPSAPACQHLLEVEDTGSTNTKVFAPEKAIHQSSETECHKLPHLEHNPDELSESKSSHSEDIVEAGNKEGKGTDTERCDGGQMPENTGYFPNSKKRCPDPSAETNGYLIGIRKRLLEMLSDLKIFIKEAKFFLAFILPCDIIGAFTFIGFSIFIVHFAISVGISETNAVFVGTVGGVGGLVARVSGTVILHFRPNWLSGQYVALCALTSLMSFLQPVKTSYTYLLVCSFFLGFGLYGSVCLIEALVANVVKPDVFPAAIAITYLTKGISSVLAAYSSGSLYDKTQSNEIVFYILGVLQAINVSIIIFLLVIKKRLGNRRSNVL